MKAKCVAGVAALIASLLICVPAVSPAATTIDFEGLGLTERTPVPPIGIASFNADITIQGTQPCIICSETFWAFTCSCGDDTGLTSPFSDTDNTFITNPGGFDIASPTKTIDVFFSEPVGDVGVLVVDVDVEAVVATIFDADDTQLGQISVLSPNAGGDGGTDVVDIGAIGGVRRLEVAVSNIVNPPLFFGIGLDNLTFSTDVTTPVSTIEPWGLALFAALVLGAICLVARRRPSDHRDA